MKPHESIENTLTFLKRYIPKTVFNNLAPLYHSLLSLFGAIKNGFPSRNIIIIGVTGTKGKSTTVEMINAILESAGKKTALSSTIRFKVGDKNEPNMYKMSMPGRGVIQKLIREAVQSSCTHMTIEITSQSVLTSRHKYLNLDALVVTNLSPEHIEAHGSFENYKEAKLEIARSLDTSTKKHTYIIVNGDDRFSDEFVQATQSASPFRVLLQDTLPYSSSENGSTFTYKGETITTTLPGEFNIYNMLCAATVCEQFGVSIDSIKKGLEGLSSIRGRVENINKDGSFGVYIDYAHTPDSLEQLYSTFKDKKIIAVLGNTGGGRDTWKRSVMAQIAEKYADTIIFTNEDPYDEDPQSIVNEMYNSLHNPSKASIILDRRDAIREAITRAKKDNVVLITGKGTDPYIMLSQGEKIPWDDARVAKEELSQLLKV